MADMEEDISAFESLGAPRCASCGKFRKDEDIKYRSVLAWDRLEEWWEPVCWWCLPFDKEAERATNR